MDSDPRLRNSAIQVLSFVGVLWFIKAWEWLAESPLVTLGVYPLETRHLTGILFGPLVHGSFEHIVANTLGLLVLGTALVYGYPRSRWRVLAVVWLLSGLGVWLFGRPSFHIGASGLTHGLFFFLLVVSVLRRDRRSIALMMMVSLLFGGMFWGVLPSEPHVSFEYHLFGGVAGVLAAFLFQRMDPKPEQQRYDWEGEDDDTPLDENSQLR
jgi:membrane associated rhomboid family serine protease